MKSTTQTNREKAVKIEVIKISDQADLEIAFKIRREVFVAEQHVPENEEYDSYENASHHYLAKINGEPCGTARWRLTGKGFKLERFAVLKPARNNGVGASILQMVLADVLKENINRQPIYLHAQVTAIPFYTVFNFKTVGDRFMECDIAHFKMEYSF